MSLQLAAQHLASKGRGPDTTLVHMAPREVAGLQALARAHGGSLTTNPDTGMPEAGFLSAILPTLVGVGLSVASGGTLTPLMAAGLVGGGTALATGNLRKGLMAGLGAYGGAGIGSLVSGAGAGAAGASALDAGMNVLPSTGTIGTTALDAGIGAFPSTGAIGAPVGLDAGMAAYPMPAPAVTPEALAGFPESAMPAAEVLPAAPPQISPYAAVNLQPPVSGFDQFKAGLGNIYDKPELLLNKENLKYGAAALAPMLFQEPKKTVVPKDTEQYRYAYSPGRSAVPTREGGAGEYTYFNPSFTRLAAEGGVMDSGKYGYDPATQTYSGGPSQAAQGGDNSFFFGAARRLAGLANAQNAPTGYAYDPTTQTYSGSLPPEILFAGTGSGMYSDGSYGSSDGAGGSVGGDSGAGVGMSNTGEGGGPAGSPGWARGGISSLAAGGASHLGDYSDGGRLLRGPGDGVSDDIPATIANKRPARLADGEFVVPARIVSELGNGSTDAGARKLYAMMDRVQKNRTKTVGKNRVAVDSRSEKLLPA